MRVSEVYTSVQGEGPNVGKPIQFVRFGGCNMKCPGWPCDTEYAINPIFRNQWQILEPEEVIYKLEPWPRHVCVTGGEPLIQRKSEMDAFLEGVLAKGYSIDLFTNGSQPIPHAIKMNPIRCTVVMDWKLVGSGEQYSGIVMRRENMRQLTRFDAVKFVVKDEVDLDEACAIYREAQDDGISCRFFVGRVWGDELTDDDIVKYVTAHQLDWCLNLQTHKFIWPDAVRGV